MLLSPAVVRAVERAVAEQAEPLLVYRERHGWTADEARALRQAQLAAVLRMLRSWRHRCHVRVGGR